MMWLLFFMCFFLVSIKNLIFLTSAMFVESNSIFMTSITPLVFFLIVTFMFSYYGDFDYMTYFLFFTSVVLVNLLCYNINSCLMFLIILEVSVFPMVYLILNYSKDLDKLSSVKFMLFINMLGSLPFMIFSSFFICFDSCSNSSFSVFSSFLNVSNVMFVSFILILVAKLPLFFFHFWLTKAHVSASGSSSMVLASLMLKLATFGMYKFSKFFLFYSSVFINWLMSLSLIGSLIFCAVMIRFFDLKYLIACSSILHMSLMMPGLMVYSSEAVLGSILMMVSHGIVSYMLFFFITILYEVSYNRTLDFNKSIESFSKTYTMILFVYIFLNVGIPPLMNFLSEFFFCLFFVKESLIGIFLLMIMMLIVILFSMFCITKTMFGKKSFLLLNDFSTFLIYPSVVYMAFLFFTIFML